MGVYTTQSIAVAASLKLWGVEPVTTVRDGRGRMNFVYERTPALTAALDAFHDGTMVFPARDLSAAQHYVRTTHIPTPSGAK